MPTRSRHVGRGETATNNMPWPKAQTQFIHLVAVWCCSYCVVAAAAAAAVNHRTSLAKCVDCEVGRAATAKSQTKVNIDNNNNNNTINLHTTAAVL